MVRLTRLITGRAGMGRATLRTCAIIGLALAGWAALTASGWASEPHNWQLGMQPPATPVKERIQAFHNELLVIIALIMLLVLGLLAYVCVKFNAKAHPVPTRTSHNTVIEILWTVVPVVILVVIAIPSFKLMYFMDHTVNAKMDMTIKVTGHQWYWEYGYPDQGNFSFNSNLIPEDQLKPGQKRLLEVDNPLVVPVGMNIRVQVAGVDVIHSWFVPSFGVQEYAVVGRLNETWFNVEHEGTYYGECNQICGINHAFMPIKIVAVSKPEFDKWAAQAKTAGVPPSIEKIIADSKAADATVVAAAISDTQPVRVNAAPAGN
jgi:cytochrome c oxidase subunit II